jgi:hypothetical protein
MGASSGVARAPQLCSGIRNHIRDFLLVQRYIHRKKPSNPTSPLSAASSRAARRVSLSERWRPPPWLRRRGDRFTGPTR